ncbi:hypothetical protein EMPG_09879, partial [Blastomyces silverae]
AAAAFITVKKIRLNSVISVSFKSFTSSIISSTSLSSHTLSITVITSFSLLINIMIYNSVRLFRADSENSLISETVI